MFDFYNISATIQRDAQYADFIFYKQFVNLFIWIKFNLLNSWTIWFN